MLSLKERQAEGDAWRMRRSQGDAQEKGHKVCTPKLGCRGAFLSSVEKAHRPTKDLCISPKFPGYRDPTVGSWNCIFPTLELPSHPGSNSRNTESP